MSMKKCKSVLICATVVLIIIQMTLMTGCEEAENGLEDVAGILSAETMGCVSIRDAAPLVRAVEEKGWPKSWADRFDAEERFGEVIEILHHYCDHLGSLHFVLDDIGEEEGDLKPEFIIIADIPERDATEEIKKLPPELGKNVKPVLDVDGKEIYRLERDDFSEPLFLARTRDRLFFGEQVELLKRVVKADQEGIPEPLANEEDYLAVASAWAEAEAFAFVAVEKVLEAIKRDMRRTRLEGFQIFGGMLGWTDARTAGVAIDSGGRGVSATLSVDESGTFYSLLADSPGREELSSFTPESSIFSVGLSIPDPETTWKRFKDHFFSILVDAGAVEDREEAMESLGVMERELGINFAEIAPFLGDEARVFLDVERETVGVIARFRDTDRAHEFFEEKGSTATVDYRGTDIVLVGHRIVPAYAQMDNVMVFSSEEGVKGIIDAIKDDDTISECETYRDITAELPESSFLQLHYDIPGITHTQEDMLMQFLLLGKRESDILEMPLGVRKWMDELQVAVSVSAEDGKVDVRFVPSNPMSATGFMETDFQDEEDLLQAARSESGLMRHAAAKELTDQELLSELARDEEYGPVLMVVIEKLTDQDMLVEIALGESPRRPRVAAIRALTDQQRLEKVARQSEPWQVRRVAVSQLRDEDLLTELAREDELWRVRFTATENLTDQEVLKEIVRDDDRNQVRRAATENLTEDQQFLAELALEDAQKSVRWAAVDNLTDVDLLEKVVEETEDDGVRRRAREKLDK